MKILYAVQATGNGHISRASEILPLLQKYGQVDVMLSGTNAHLPVDLPVKHRSKGLSLFYRLGGGLNYLKMLKQINPFRIWADIKRLPVESYDLVINDFDFNLLSVFELVFVSIFDPFLGLGAAGTVATLTGSNFGFETVSG